MGHTAIEPGFDEAKSTKNFKVDVIQGVKRGLSNHYSREILSKIFKYEAINVFDDRWRVNCWVNAASPRIAYSFFLRYTPDEGIMQVSPQFNDPFVVKWGQKVAF